MEARSWMLLSRRVKAMTGSCHRENHRNRNINKREQSNNPAKYKLHHNIIQSWVWKGVQQGRTMLLESQIGAQRISIPWKKATSRESSKNRLSLRWSLKNLRLRQTVSCWIFPIQTSHTPLGVNPSPLSTLRLSTKILTASVCCSVHHRIGRQWQVPSPDSEAFRDWTSTTAESARISVRSSAQSHFQIYASSHLVRFDSNDSELQRLRCIHYILETSHPDTWRAAPGYRLSNVDSNPRLKSYSLKRILKYRNKLKVLNCHLDDVTELKTRKHTTHSESYPFELRDWEFLSKNLRNIQILGISKTAVEIVGRKITNEMVKCICGGMLSIE